MTDNIPFVSFCVELQRWYAALGHRYISADGSVWKYAADAPGGCLYGTQEEARAATAMFTEKRQEQEGKS